MTQGLVVAWTTPSTRQRAPLKVEHQALRAVPRQVPGPHRRARIPHRGRRGALHRRARDRARAQPAAVRVRARVPAPVRGGLPALPARRAGRDRAAQAGSGRLRRRTLRAPTPRPRPETRRRSSAAGRRALTAAARPRRSAASRSRSTSSSRKLGGMMRYGIPDYRLPD